MRPFYRKLPLLYLALLIFFTVGITGCGKSPELENYERCVELLNHERKEARKSQTTVTIPSVFWNAGLPSSMVPEKTTTRHFPTWINKNNSEKFTELFLEYRLPVHQLIANFWCFEIIRS